MHVEWYHLGLGSTGCRHGSLFESPMHFRVVSPSSLLANSPHVQSHVHSPTPASKLSPFLDKVPTTLKMFCLQNTQMFVCVLNSRTNIGCFYIYLSVMDNKYFHVVFNLNQTLNSLRNKHILSNLKKLFCCLNKLFSH